MQTIEEMVERRAVMRYMLVVANNRAKSIEQYRTVIKWINRECTRYTARIAEAALAEGNTARARTVAEAQSDKPLSELGRMSDEAYRRAMDEELMRKLDKEDEYDRRHPYGRDGML